MALTSKSLAVALAGGIALAGCATVEEEVGEAIADTYRADLAGTNEVGGGDPDGYGKAEISISDSFDQVCWEVKDVTGIGPVTAAHIHSGVAGQNGPPVFTLRKSNEGAWEGCTDGSEWTQDRIEGNPGAFYVNLHTAEYPNGAIRGQLRR